eukprot:3713321-Amphidinium_carterae.1
MMVCEKGAHEFNRQTGLRGLAHRCLQGLHGVGPAAQESGKFCGKFGLQINYAVHKTELLLRLHGKGVWQSLHEHAEA